MGALTLVADIGGTNTRVALARGAVVDATTVRRYTNAEMGQFDDVLRRFLDDSATAPGSLDGACVAGAGPVHQGVVTLTNLDWRVGPDLLRDILGVTRCAVLNDLQAQGHALGHAAKGTETQIIVGSGTPQGENKLVVGVGTGFNVAPVLETPGGRVVMPSEAGHICLPHISADADQVIAYLNGQFGFASVEEALSGRGLAQVDAAFGQNRDAPALMAALKAGDASAERSLRTVVALLGAVVGDLALITLPFGGITLVGGVARHLQPWLAPFGFAEAMRAKGRFGPFLEQFSVSVLSDDYAALTGCARHLSQTN